MSSVTKQAGFDRNLRSRIEGILTRTLVTAAEQVGKGVMRNTPVEDGHAHAAWKAAFDQVPGIDVQAPDGTSHDPKAVSAGSAESNLSGIDQSIVLHNKLGFVRKIEYGLEIKPIGVGKKSVPPKTIRKTIADPPGPLYHPRLAEGRGVLVWKGADGRLHRGLSFTEPPSSQRPVGRALEQAKESLK